MINNKNKYQKIHVLFVYGKHKYTDYIKITGIFFENLKMRNNNRRTGQNGRTYSFDRALKGGERMLKFPLSTASLSLFCASQTGG